MKRPIYVLGTGLSHDGSACLLKDGKICVAVEKERITRIKHDGGNDTDAILYCLNAEGITLNDVELVVQNANFGFFEYGNGFYDGSHRLFSNCKVPIVTISHHLAHAYYGLGASPFHETSVLVVDGCGSLMDETMDHDDATFVPECVKPEIKHLHAEKDSYYYFDGSKVKTLYKDYSPFGMVLKKYPMHPQTTMHSIGGVYGAASHYCFGESSDLGKLMGLAPYGKGGVYNFEVFNLRDDRVYVNYDWMSDFKKPVTSYGDLFENFQYYADIAYWIQRETERAILYLIDSRYGFHSSENLVFSGGVALNAVANARIVRESKFKNVYFTPAAGDNGLAIGCAYYGWLEVLKKERVKHHGGSNFGISYSDQRIKGVLENFFVPESKNIEVIFNAFKNALCEAADIGSEKENYKIQLFISESGVHSFSFAKGTCRYTNGTVQDPDCTIMCGGVAFIRALNDFSLFGQDMNITGNPEPLFKIAVRSDLRTRIKRYLAQSSSQTCSRFSYHDNISKKAATLLAEEKILGWFQDGCEFGPRALGFRSIIADPRKSGVRDFINARIKFREEFRPFAPSVLLEDAPCYFDFESESPYMIQVAQVKEEWRKQLSSVMHLDNSSRIQTVSKDWSKKYHQLLTEFKELTGLPIILNTSFNKRGMPIVETPEQALNYFYECKIDAVVIGNYLVEK